MCQHKEPKKARLKGGWGRATKEVSRRAIGPPEAVQLGEEWPCPNGRFVASTQYRNSRLSRSFAARPVLTFSDPVFGECHCFIHLH